SSAKCRSVRVFSHENHIFLFHFVFFPIEIGFEMVAQPPEICDLKKEADEHKSRLKGTERFILPLFSLLSRVSVSF
ncbi:hypothetical protein GE061_017796, partial [Apolygus lucorum]